MASRASLLLLVSAIALPTFAPAVARAETPARASVVEAQEHYTRGREAYRLGLYGGALEEFERSLALVPSPNTRLYIARALRELGRWSEAAQSYERTIHDAEASGSRYAATREAAEVELRDVVVRLERAAPAVATAPAPAFAPASAEAPERSGASRPSHGPSAMTWASGGVAVAGGVSFAVLYALASDRFAYLEASCTRTRDATCDDARSTGRTQELAAYVSLGVAVVAAVVTVATLVTGRSTSNAPLRATGRGEPWRASF